PSELLMSPAALQAVADHMAGAVLRTELTESGSCLLDLGPRLTPRDFRALLLALGRALGTAYGRDFDGELGFVSLSRFHQQVSTPPHLDAGPDESLLLLGYEPTEVASRVFLYDYTHCALDRGLTPRDFLDRFNPTFRGDQEALEGYRTEVSGLNPDHYQILA